MVSSGVAHLRGVRGCANMESFRESSVPLCSVLPVILILGVAREIGDILGVDTGPPRIVRSTGGDINTPLSASEVSTDFGLLPLLVLFALPLDSIFVIVDLDSTLGSVFVFLVLEEDFLQGS